MIKSKEKKIIKMNDTKKMQKKIEMVKKYLKKMAKIYQSRIKDPNLRN